MSGTTESAGRKARSLPSRALHDALADLIRDLRRAWGDESEIGPAPGVPRMDGRSSLDAAALVGPHAHDPETADLTPEERSAELARIAGTVSVCTRCKLSEGRQSAVPGVLPLDPRVLVIGEAPGAEEDRSGEPFVGRAGEYLDRWLSSIGLARDRDAAITNVVKCRPPGNRDPQASEILACAPYLRRQIALIRPKSILTVGRFSARLIVGRDGSMASFRGELFRYGAIPVVCTYHPSAVLRDPGLRRPVWEDLQRLDQLARE